MHWGKSRLNIAHAVTAFELPPSMKERELGVRVEQFRALQWAKKAY